MFLIWSEFLHLPRKIQSMGVYWTLLLLMFYMYYASNIQGKYVQTTNKNIQKKHWLIKSILMSSVLTLYSLSTVCLYMCFALFINESSITIIRTKLRVKSQ